MLFLYIDFKNYKKFAKMIFANFYELDKENDLKEPLSKFYRDIYKQITEPHLYDLLEDKR